jgi:hypothetical protein
MSYLCQGYSLFLSYIVFILTVNVSSDPFCDQGNILSVFFNTVATGHMWLLRISNVPRETENMNFKVKF